MRVIRLRIGVFGGTFNPPHIGHVASAKTAAQQLGLDLLIVVPSGTPPHKEMPQASPSAEMRVQMTRHAFAEIENAVISDIEATKNAPSYTIDTIKTLKKEYPGAEMYLLVGDDMYLTLDTWKDSETLLKNATPAVFSRENGRDKEISDYSQHLMEQFGTRTEIIQNSAIDISSSKLREILPLRGGIDYLPEICYTYIIKHRLYGAKPDWNWLRDRAYSMLDPSRVPHVAGCEQEAIRLAERWGVDIDDAREAAILHDITKKLDAEEHIRLLVENDIPSTMPPKNEEKLLHSKTGALLARTEFGVSEAVADAIMWHTTGRVKMTTLDKVIYLTDYIEPSRDIDGIDALRALAYENLDDAMRMGLEMSVRDMESRGIIPNRTTFDALNDLTL